MGLVLDVLGVLLLIGGAIVGLFLLMLVMPVRVGVMVRGDLRADGGAGNVRLFGGLLGVGVRADRGTREEAKPIRLTFGVMLWRRLIPVLTREISEPDEPGGEREPATPPGPEKPPPPTSAPEPPPAPRVEPEPAPSEPLEEPTGDVRAAASEPEYRNVTRETTVAPEASDRVDAQPVEEADGPGRIETARNLFREWWPVARGALSRLRGIIRVRRFHVNGALGLNDPALTAQAVGIAYASRGLSTPSGLLAVLGINRGAFRVNVDPVFDGIVLRGSIDVEWRISLRRIWSVTLYVGWVLALRWWRSWRAARAAQRTAGQPTN